MRELRLRRRVHRSEVGLGCRQPGQGRCDTDGGGRSRQPRMHTVRCLCRDDSSACVRFVNAYLGGPSGTQAGSPAGFAYACRECGPPGCATTLGSSLVLPLCMRVPTHLCTPTRRQGATKSAWRCPCTGLLRLARRSTTRSRVALSNAGASRQRSQVAGGGGWGAMRRVLSQ